VVVLLLLLLLQVPFSVPVPATHTDVAPDAHVVLLSELSRWCRKAQALAEYPSPVPREILLSLRMPKSP
jgi:hypothetical protein